MDNRADLPTIRGFLVNYLYTFRECFVLSHEVSQGEVPVSRHTFGKVDGVGVTQRFSTGRLLPLAEDVVEPVGWLQKVLDKRTYHDGSTVDERVVRTSDLVQFQSVELNTTGWRKNFCCCEEVWEKL